MGNVTQVLLCNNHIQREKTTDKCQNLSIGYILVLKSESKLGHISVLLQHADNISWIHFPAQITFRQLGGIRV